MATTTTGPLASLEDWLLANAGSLLATGAVELFLLGGGWIQTGIISFGNAYWQQWWQQQLAGSLSTAAVPPYQTLFQSMSVVVPMGLLHYLLGTSLPVGAMIGLAGYAGSLAQYYVITDLNELKKDL